MRSSSNADIVIAEGVLKKSAFHKDVYRSIKELNRCRTSDLSLMDGTLGLAEYHLGGVLCDPPANKVIAGFDPVEIDRKAAFLLGLDWRRISHLLSL